MEYCAVCGDSEFDTDGGETHVDEEYDHDFEYMEIAEHPDAKADRRHKESIKWTKIALIVGAVIGISAIIISLI